MFVPTRKRSGWRFPFFLGLTAVVLLVTSCAVSFRGTTQGIPFDSNPQGAEVYLDGELVGVTPVTVELGRGSGHTLLVRLGGQERQVILTNSVDPLGGGLLFLDVVPGGGVAVTGVALTGSRGGWTLDFTALTYVGVATAAIPLVIDLATGAVYELSPAEVMIDFESEDEGPRVEEGEGDAR